MRYPLKALAGAAISLALCASPTMAAAATPTPVQPINPLVAVSVFGTQASAQAVSTQMAAAAATSEAAVAAQSEYDQDAGITTVGWVMIALDILIAGWGIYTLFNDDNDDGESVPVSPN